ncbi:hypothetical protein [Bradyrhizobium sp.]|uniref:hypothetical protein n=1 Tax=Bradyrhizobium sp. TaxID=376 RepID=UPI0025C1B6DE|nr:hypothetical protein [Bradyrhizobium sp.]
MGTSPSMMPDVSDRDTYLVLDDFGSRLGRAWREIDEHSSDSDTLIRDLFAGEYVKPARIVAFTTAERLVPRRDYRYCG